MTEFDVLRFTKELVKRASVSPEDAGCQLIIKEQLETWGFTCEFLNFGDVSNLWARLGSEAPVFAFAGHTDVVPVGDLDSWLSPPFEACEREGFLYGRGVADMKGSLAAMLAATQQLVNSGEELKGSLAFLITSDEEGPAINGTVKVMEALEKRGEHIDWCLIGEPSSAEKLGDCVRVGRRGSLSFELKVKGIQGHVAYPEKADNPIHKIADFLKQMTQTVWDHGNNFFPATSFQFSNIHGGTGAGNVIPGYVQLSGNFRFSTESSEVSLKTRTEQILKDCALNYEIHWNLSGAPFLTQGGALIEAACKAIEKNCQVKPELSTGGGTSDGRFIAPYGVEVLELGPINASIHKINESLDIADLYKLSDCYFDILQALLTDG